MENNLQHSAEKLIDDAANTTQEAADKTLRTASNVLDSASERLTAARSRAGEAIDSLNQRAHEYARVGLEKAGETRDRAKRQVQHAADVTSHYVEEQPLRSVAIAAGVDALTAAVLLMLRGRDR